MLDPQFEPNIILISLPREFNTIQKLIKKIAAENAFICKSIESAEEQLPTHIKSAFLYNDNTLRSTLRKIQWKCVNTFTLRLYY